MVRSGGEKMDGEIDEVYRFNHFFYRYGKAFGLTCSTMTDYKKTSIRISQGKANIVVINIEEDGPLRINDPDDEEKMNERVQLAYRRAYNTLIEWIKGRTQTNYIAQNVINMIKEEMS